MSMIRNGQTLVLGALVTACGLSMPALAATSASDPFISIQATRGSFSGTINVPLSSVIIQTEPDSDIFFWATTNPVPIFDGPNLVATLVNMTVLAGRNTLVSGEQRWGIDIDFGVQAGATATTFNLFSPILSFDPLNNARATTSATLGGTDQNSDGITISPALGGGQGFRTFYNGASVFRSYFSNPLTNGPSGSVGDAGNMTPPGAFDPIAGSVSSMQSVFGFTVSAGDAAAGTTTYSVAPAPGAVALLGLGGLVAGRRRRNR